MVQKIPASQGYLSRITVKGGLTLEGADIVAPELGLLCQGRVLGVEVQMHFGLSMSNLLKKKIRFDNWKLDTWICRFFFPMKSN